MEDNKIFKFVFIADVKTVTLALKFSCVVSIFWKRGQKAAEVKERKQIQGGIVKFNQKLEIQCNMVYNPKTQIFEEKKTKFTIVIFSEKGTKQAGEVYLDVGQFLNSKAKKKTYEKNLEKCPDKSAKLSFELSGYMKEQITSDKVSQSSTRTFNVEALPSSNIQPNFKKKKKDESLQQNEKKDMNRKKSERNILPVAKQNIPKVQYIALESQNKKLKGQIKELKQIQMENQTLKRQYDETQKKLKAYYRKKYEQLKEQNEKIKQKSDNVKAMKENKAELESELHESKKKMADILNYAITKNISSLAQEFYNIYEKDQIQ